MKIPIQPIVFLILVQLLSCKDAKDTTSKTSEKQETELITTTNTKTAQKEEKEQGQNLGVYYVSALSGLNFRDAPNGKVLDKFPLNTRLVVTEKTNSLETIDDGDKTIDGEWLGVAHNQKTVYVFSGFLSPYYTYSEQNVYMARPYQYVNNAPIIGFVNVSETYFMDYSSSKSSGFPKNKLGNDTIRFNQDERLKFLDRINHTENDTLFIYNLLSDSIYKFKLKELPVVAFINPYEEGLSNLDELSYQIGFSLGKQYTTKGDAFAILGTTNPFVTDQLEVIDWQKIDASIYSEKFVNSKIPKNRNHWFKGFTAAETYNYVTENAIYYIQNLNKDGQFKHRYLVVEDIKTGVILFEDVQLDSESSYITPLVSEDKNQYTTQWTGSIFKDRHAILYGFMSHSIGCPSIHFLGENEPEINIRCDNRH